MVLNRRHCILKLNKNEKGCFRKDSKTQGMGNVKVANQRWSFLSHFTDLVIHFECAKKKICAHKLFPVKVDSHN